MDELTFFAVRVAATTAARLYDPLVWLLIGGCAWLGFERQRAAWSLAAGLAVTLVTIAVLYSWWRETGLAHKSAELSLRILFTTLAIALAAHYIGRLASRLLAR